MIQITVNDREQAVDAEPDTPLLWVLRDVLKLKGTKFGCGAGLCGACTVHVDGVAVRSCTMSLEAARDKHITTIEGLGATPEHPIQKQWIEHRVPQCGYCQPGMIMATIAFLKTHPQPTPDEVRKAVTNICRCGTYNRVLDAIMDAAANGSEQ